MTAHDLPEAKIEIVDPGGAYPAAAAKPSRNDLQEAYDALSEAILELYRLGFDGTGNEATVALATLWAEATAPKLAAEGRKPNPEPAGVGEARPAEPPTRAVQWLRMMHDDAPQMSTTKLRSGQVLAELAERDGLREQLDAGERDNTRLLNECVEAEDRVSVLTGALEEALSYRRTGRMPHDVLERLRAALGDVAAGESLEANSAKNAEVRATADKEA